MTSALNLLDTNILSELMRPRPSPRLVARLDQTPVEQQLVSSISVGEHRLTLVTANVRHFARVPSLKVENWL